MLKSIRNPETIKAVFESKVLELQNGMATFVHVNQIIQITMRYKFPWKETPVLYGEDAIRFEKEMERVDNMSAEERRANAEALRKRVEKFCKEWNVTIKI